MDQLKEILGEISSCECRTILTSLLVALLFAVLVKALLTSYLKNSKLPPGPIGLPFFGYSPFLKENSFEEFGRKYGNIYSVRMGPRALLVILNDYPTYKEVYLNSLTLDRASEATAFLSNVGFGAMNGAEWQEQRRFSRYLTRDLGIGKNKWEEQIQEKAEKLAEKLSAQKGRPIDISRDIHQALLDNILSFLIGESEVKPSEIELALKYSALALTELSPSSILNGIPVLRTLFQLLHVGQHRDQQRIVREFLDFLKNKVDKHKTAPGYRDIEDFIILYWNKQEELTKQGKKHFFSEFNLIGNLNAFFLGSGDTLYSSLTWMFRLVAKYPEIQAKIQNELDEATERGVKISFGNRSEVPYMTAFMLEMQRYASIVPLATARRVINDIHVGEYVLPKGIWVSGNLRAMHYDPNYWNEPEKFNPMRFLSEDGKKILTNKESYAPFSLGKRNCPGENIAWMGLMIFFPYILQRFDISAKPGEEVKFEEDPGLVTHLKPQKLCFTERAQKQP